MAGFRSTLASLPLVWAADAHKVVFMALDVLLAALVLVVVPASVRPVRRSQSPHPGRSTVPLSLWARCRAELHEFWDRQLHLQELYLSRFDVSGGDALRAMARRKPPR